MGTYFSTLLYKTVINTIHNFKKELIAIYLVLEIASQMLPFEQDVSIGSPSS